MIRFHYHTAQKAVPRLDIRKGDPLCHVYSDRSLEELVAWGRAHGLRPEWIHRHSSMPHFDAFGPHLEACGEGVSRRELAEDLRGWRRARAEGRAEPGPAARRAGRGGGESSRGPAGLRPPPAS